MDSTANVELEESDLEVRVTKSYTQLLDQICKDEFFNWTPSECSSEAVSQCSGDVWLSDLDDTFRDFEQGRL